MKFKNLLTVASLVLGLGATSGTFASSDLPSTINIGRQNMLIAGFDEQTPKSDDLTLSIVREFSKSCFRENYLSIPNNASFDDTNPNENVFNPYLPPLIPPTPPLPEVIKTLHNRTAVIFHDSYERYWINSDGYGCWTSLGRANQQYALYLNYKKSNIKLASFYFETNFASSPDTVSYNGVLNPIVTTPYYDEAETKSQLYRLGISLNLNVPLFSSLPTDELYLMPSITPLIHYGYYMYEQTIVLPVTVSVRPIPEGLFIPCPNHTGQLTTNDQVVSNSPDNRSILWTASIPQTMSIDTSIGYYGPMPPASSGNSIVLVCQGEIRNSTSSPTYRFTNFRLNTGNQLCLSDENLKGFNCYPY